MHCADLVPVHKLLADDILADARGWHQVVKLVEELHAALVMLRGSFTQLVPQDLSHILGTGLHIKQRKSTNTRPVKRKGKTTKRPAVTSHGIFTLKKSVLSAMNFSIP